MDSISEYHSLEFICMNYILEGEVFLELKLSSTELTTGRYLMKRQYESGIGWVSIQTKP